MEERGDEWRGGWQLKRVRKSMPRESSFSWMWVSGEKIDEDDGQVFGVKESVGKL